MNAELIPIREHDGKQAVSGRELHEFLQITTPYTKWFDRMLEYGFTQGVDHVDIFVRVPSDAGGRDYEQRDHALTLDMAKELSMLQRNERGKQARRYFIEVEKRARAMSPALPGTYADALRELASTVEQNAALEAKVEADEPKVAYVDEFVRRGDVRLFRNVAKCLGMKESELRDDLLTRKWIYGETIERYSKTKRRDIEVNRYSAYADKARYFYPAPNHDAPRFKGEAMHTLKITPRGAIALAKLYNVDPSVMDDESGLGEVA
ncbi:phage anti-repressor protein [Leucobacter luti]|uniref:antA/AntB antirepressor family protein n=1 Tax=Leucobacter luti TaxID=340320 RepID=UPI0010E0F133|nr:antA/AntB antirepressor family protein [Leucobacter luti]MCW2286995.1 phage anti-repressor protein/phage antirepressor YoqD-like protein [Leucobacter luti]TCK41221.1 phage anti-repressor protein [Leucobacter luti]